MFQNFLSNKLQVGSPFWLNPGIKVFFFCPSGSFDYSELHGKMAALKVSVRRKASGNYLWPGTTGFAEKRIERLRKYIYSSIGITRPWQTLSVGSSILADNYLSKNSKWCKKNTNNFSYFSSSVFLTGLFLKKQTFKKHNGCLPSANLDFSFLDCYSLNILCPHYPLYFDSLVGLYLS